MRACVGDESRAVFADPKEKVATIPMDDDTALILRDVEVGPTRCRIIWACFMHVPTPWPARYQESSISYVSAACRINSSSLALARDEVRGLMIWARSQ
jgi:hypothetical protein